MQKIIKRVYVSTFFSERGESLEIKRVKEDLEVAEKLGATHISIEEEDYYGMPQIVLQAFLERMETDEEANNRLETIKKQDLNTLKQIQKKYGI
jgi:hypothetical protein